MNKYFSSAEENGKMNYAVYAPERTQGLPLVVFLHGAGERGRNYEHNYRHAIPMLIRQGREYDAIILCPQCPADAVWDNVIRDVKAIIDTVAEQFGADPDRISITGCSMGGFGTWMMALSYPNFFAAAAPVAGGGMSWRTPNLRTTPIRAYHSPEDTAVPIIYSQLMVEGVKANGGAAELIEVPGFGHNDSINHVYRTTDIVQWLTSHKKSREEQVLEILHDMF